MLAQPLFGRRLRQLRQQQGKSRADLIGPGMSAAYLSRLESGERPPTERVVHLLAERLQVSTTEFEVSDHADMVDVLAAVMAAEGASGPMHELRFRLERALEAEQGADLALRWQAYSQLARIRGEEGDRPAERQALIELVSLSDQLRHNLLQVNSRLRLARCQRALGDIEETRTTARAALEISEAASLAEPDALRCKLLLISATAEIGDLAEAGRLSMEACSDAEGLRGELAAEVLWTSATVSTRLGGFEQAADLLTQAMAVLDSRDNLTLWMRLRLAGADLLMQAEPADLDTAEAYLNAVDPVVSLIGNQLHAQENAFLRAKLAFLKGDLAGAAAHCEEAGADLHHMTFRDRVRFEMLNEQIRTRTGAKPSTRLRELALEAQGRGMLDLATQLWRTLAELGD